MSNNFPITLETLAVRISELEKRIDRDLGYIREMKTASDKALDLQAKEYERRLEMLNNEASRIAKIQADYVPKGEYNLVLESKEKRIRDLEVYRGSIDSQIKDMNDTIATLKNRDTIAYIIGVIGGVGAAVATWLGLKPH